MQWVLLSSHRVRGEMENLLSMGLKTFALYTTIQKFGGPPVNFLFPMKSRANMTAQGFPNHALTF